LKNTGKKFLVVTARINLVKNGKFNYKDYKPKEWECIPNTFEESEQLILEIAEVMRKYGTERPEHPLKVASP
jgi:hypothetical protein